MIILTLTRCANHSALGFKFKTGSCHDLPLITCVKSACLQMYLKSTSNINKNQKLCLTGLFKLFVARSSWRILNHRLNNIFHCHLLRILESFHDTSKIPTFTLLIKINEQLHLKMLSCNFYFLKNLTDIRHIILPSAKKFKNSFLEGVLQMKLFSLQVSLSCLTLFFFYYHSYSGL